MRILLQSFGPDPSDYFPQVFCVLAPILLIAWFILIRRAVKRKRSRSKPQRAEPVSGDFASATPDNPTLDYQALENMRQEQGLATAKAATRVVGCVGLIVLCITTAVMVLIGISLLGDEIARLKDKPVRQWMDGPRTDPVTSLILTGDTAYGPMEADLVDPKSLACLNTALPNALRDFPNPQGRWVYIELHLKSGRVIKTGGGVSPAVLTIEISSGGDNWDVVTLEFPSSAPMPLLQMLSFAEKSSGKKSF